MLNMTMLRIIEEAGVAVLTLTEDMEEEEFLRSRLIRGEVRQHVLTISEIATRAPADLRDRLPELDWDGLSRIERHIRSGGSDSDPTLWHAARSQVPTALIWLRVYRQNEPALFA